MIKNIIFDMGNVLVDFRPEIAAAHFFQDPEDQAIMLNEFFNQKEWVMSDEGIYTNDQLYDAVKGKIPERLHKAFRDCVDSWDTYAIYPIQESLPFIKRMKEKGYCLYVLSNANDLFHRFFPRFYDHTLFDGVMVSCDVKMIKPHLEIYQHFLKTFRLEGSECLFIDDRPVNVEGAKQAGMQAHVFANNYEEIERLYQL